MYRCCIEENVMKYSWKRFSLHIECFGLESIDRCVAIDVVFFFANGRRSSLHTDVIVSIMLSCVLYYIMKGAVVHGTTRLY